MKALDQIVTVYGIAERHENRDALDERVEEIHATGFTLPDSGLSIDQLQAIRTSLDVLCERQASEAGGEEGLDRCNDRDVIRCPLIYDKAFLELAAHPVLTELARRLLGGNILLLQQNGVVNRPGRKHHQLRWHRDLNYQHWVATQPFAISALLCVDPFTFETGATYFLPHSQMHEKFPSDTFVRRHQQVMEAAPGTFLVFDAMVFHRAGINVSNQPRRAVNHMIGRPFMAQQINIPGLLDPCYAQDAFLSKYLGYRWAPAPSVLDWRKQRMA